MDLTNYESKRHKWALKNLQQSRKYSRYYITCCDVIIPQLSIPTGAWYSCGFVCPNVPWGLFLYDDSILTISEIKSHCGHKSVQRPYILYIRGFPILIRWRLYIETCPRCQVSAANSEGAPWKWSETGPPERLAPPCHTPADTNGR